MRNKVELSELRGVKGLPELLSKYGIDPADYLRRVAEEPEVDSIWCRVVPEGYPRPSRYVTGGLNWRTQPEGADFWMEIAHRWENILFKEEWPALEAALGWLDPLEAELLEVRDDVVESTAQARYRPR